ncbi:hypothetical protein FM112_05645 [Gulosibacter sp. 10]|nr:hypothetical protein FM112_05645 [Gulosibacter sp. 10]
MHLVESSASAVRRAAVPVRTMRRRAHRSIGLGVLGLIVVAAGVGALLFGGYGSFEGLAACVVMGALFGMLVAKGGSGSRSCAAGRRRSRSSRRPTASRSAKEG